LHTADHICFAHVHFSTGHSLVYIDVNIVQLISWILWLSALSDFYIYERPDIAASITENVLIIHHTKEKEGCNCFLTTFIHFQGPK